VVENKVHRKRMKVHFINFLSKWDEWVEYQSHRIGGKIDDVLSSDSESDSEE
jgi:hypothetical protein